MKVTQTCADCLWNRQQKLTDHKEYLSEIRQILDSRRENDCAPYLIYRFNEVYERYFGRRPSYQQEKKAHNDLVLSMEADLCGRLASSPDPLMTAFVYARIGNYIDLGALGAVDKATFLSLFDEAVLPEQDKPVYGSFLRECSKGRTFLLIADNSGEIVLDKLFLEQLKQAFPHLELTVMVRGGEVLNDVTVDDAKYVHIDELARIVSNGRPLSGTVVGLLSEEARHVLDTADIVFAKGQGNYESLAGQGRHVFYSFLCKCDYFTNQFHVPKLTGLFLEEPAALSKK